MIYQRIRDIIPELVKATQQGKIKWKLMYDEPNDFYVLINNYKIEIELKMIGETSEEQQLKVCVYLWNGNGSIIDSEYIGRDSPDFGKYALYYETIKTNALDVSSILQGIVDSLESAS